MATPGSDIPAGSSKSPNLSRFVRRASKLFKPSRGSGTPDIGIPADVQSKTVSVPQGSSTFTRSDTGLSALAISDGRAFYSSAQYLKQREEKARALFTKYGMTLAADEWTSPSTGRTQWIEKKIVMRVHRQCHRCQTTFGRDKICNQCQHTRCKKCPRWPIKVSAEPALPAGYELDYSVVIDPLHALRGTNANTRTLTIQTKSGREAVRKPPTQRVRRTCHRCSTLFAGKAAVCTKCQHPRCPKCPRDPPKANKWPNGYPGDAEEQFPLAERVRKPIRLRFRWECHTCNIPFIEHEKVCHGCGHERCDECPRKPPKKVKKEPEDEVLKSVEEKIKQMSLRSNLGSGSKD